MKFVQAIEGIILHLGYLVVIKIECTQFAEMLESTAAEALQLIIT